MNIVECSGLTKKFPGKRGTAVTALSSLSFELPAGKIVGLLGPDGSGKTTLLRILAGLYRPDSGSARVLGFDVRDNPEEIQRRIGYMPQKFGLYENLSVGENLTLYADLHAVPPELREERFSALLEMTALTPFRGRMGGQLSGGMKQKLALACALVAQPPLLLLDEPTVGVDILSRRELWLILRRLVDAGKVSVFASTAYMDEADYCDRTLILFQGSLIADAPPAEISGRAEGALEKPTFEDGFIQLLSGGAPTRLKRKHPVSPDAPPMIRAADLVKKFGSFTAVDHVGFEVKRGEIFGLLGANGAGKTTTFRMLCGLSRADGGTIEIGGVNLRKAPGSARAKLGYVAQKFSLYGDLSVRENLEFFGGAYGLHGKLLRERIARTEADFSLAPFMNVASGRLPPGFKQRLSMGCALLHDPEILFLDEATSGADPLARREFWERIISLADNGVAVIITTHFLDEAEYCDRMVIMDSGRAIASGPAEEIRRAGNSEKLEDAFVSIIARERERRSP